ncbi:MAG TPA: DUF488 family protein [Arenibacter sp.]|nr:DUF488 family protein [Arenibacter sp.]
MKKILIKRIYDPTSEHDGYRILVDRIWPRSVSKEHAHLDDWIKEVAPTGELRKWFDHDPKKFGEFEERYRSELKDRSDILLQIRKIAADRTVTLLYGAKDTEHNQAKVLQKVLEE